jgi:hypothetical protein
LVSLIALIGIAFVSIGESKLKQLIFFMVSLAVGSLFGDAFIHLLPRTFRQFNDPLAASLWVMSGIFSFFILEKFLLWRHQHTYLDDFDAQLKNDFDYAIECIDPDGTVVEVLSIEGEGLTTNCCFGGPELRTLFVADALPGTLLAFEGMPTPGLPLPLWPGPA